MSNRVTAAWSGGGVGWSILVHGGAGTVPEASRPHHAQGCREAAAAGAELLRSGAPALEAVQRAVELLEDAPQFNAGTGASLTVRGDIELDAAVMEGTTLRAGGVCALGPFKNPIAVARSVLEEGAHVLYAGAGANAFAVSRGFEQVAPDTLVTPAARRKLEAAIAAGQAANWAGGTVGAVARDAQGQVAAATSTGGTAGKRPGRVGDSPLIGAGTLADDQLGAVSATGWGEGILRLRTASHAASLLPLHSPRVAAELTIDALRSRLDAPAGVILAAPDGRLGWARSTATMSWGACWDGAGTVLAGY